MNIHSGTQQVVSTESLSLVMLSVTTQINWAQHQN
jgi:hypothetical protein